MTPPQWRAVRAGACVYAIGVGLCWALPTPIGSNVERLALLTGAAILFCAAPASDQRKITTFALATGIAAWTVAQPIADIIHTTPVTTADARPLITQLLRLDAQRGRVEVPHYYALPGPPGSPSTVSTTTRPRGPVSPATAPGPSKPATRSTGARPAPPVR